MYFRFSTDFVFFVFIQLPQPASLCCPQLKFLIIMIVSLHHAYSHILLSKNYCFEDFEHRWVFFAGNLIVNHMSYMCCFSCLVEYMYVLDTPTVVGIAFAAFVIGAMLTGALWFIYSHTGESHYYTTHSLTLTVCTLSACKIGMWNDNMI